MENKTFYSPRLWRAACIAFRRIGEVAAQAAEGARALGDAFAKQKLSGKYKRVQHLALHAKKQRTRKKNANRIKRAVMHHSSRRENGK